MKTGRSDSWTIMATTDFSYDVQEAMVKKYRGILNKLTYDNADKLFTDLIELIQANPDCTARFVDELFEKTCCDSEFANIYALFCSHISKVVRTSPVSVNNFLYRVVRRFQTEFEHRAYKENKQKTLTAILFLAKLFHVYVLNETVAHMCLKSLLRTKECQQYPLEKKLEFIEADLTYFCKIMELIGERLDQPNTGQKLINQYMLRVKSIFSKYKIQPRIRFMFQNLEERRANGWVNRKPKHRIDQHEVVANQSSLHNRHLYGVNTNAVHNIQSFENIENRDQWKQSRNSSISLTDPPKTEKAFTPTILRRGMHEHEIFNTIAQHSQAYKKDAARLPSNSKSNIYSIIDNEMEAFMTNASKKFTSTVNNIKRIVFANGYSSYLVYSIIKQSLPYGDSNKKMTSALFKELYSTNVFSKNECEQGVCQIIEEISDLETLHSCVKSHVASIIVQLHNLKALHIPHLLKTIYTQNDKSTNLTSDTLLQFLLILLQTINQTEGKEENCIATLQECINVEPKWLILFDNWNSGICDF
ncbi:hypothetical protein GJ496_002296 [Pomphorhynchus laevis]|nr:hypothetical protein GJ496_002296 [Pomphorhynchus laevis]